MEMCSLYTYLSFHKQYEFFLKTLNDYSSYFCHNLGLTVLGNTTVIFIFLSVIYTK